MKVKHEGDSAINRTTLTDHEGNSATFVTTDRMGPERTEIYVKDQSGRTTDSYIATADGDVIHSNG